ncbi:hypothetical protein V5785_06215 [Bacillus subtilis]
MNNFQIGDYAYLENIERTAKLTQDIIVSIANDTPAYAIRLATDEEIEKYQLKEGAE